MKKGMLTLVMVAFTVLSFLAVGTFTAANVTDAPDVVKIENEGYKSDKKGHVNLSHKKHQVEYINPDGNKISCAECHHEYKDGKNVWKEGQPVKKCGDCHDPKKKVDKVKKLQLAYHSNCKNCHKALVKAGKSKNAPYKKCTGCHQKKSK